MRTLRMTTRRCCGAAVLQLYVAQRGARAGVLGMTTRCCCGAAVLQLYVIQRGGASVGWGRLGAV